MSAPAAPPVTVQFFPAALNLLRQAVLVAALIVLVFPEPGQWPVFTACPALCVAVLLVMKEASND